MIVEAQDCSPLRPQPKSGQIDWLQRLTLATSSCRNIISIGSSRRPDEPIVHCYPDGTWYAGRYVGSLSFEGGRLSIRPRFGIATLRNWLCHVTNIELVDSPGVLREDESFIVQLLAAVWALALGEASRHGLPALRQDANFTGPVLRGRLDVRSSVRLLAAGGSSAVSVRRERSLDHAVSRVIVAAYALLRKWLGRNDADWLPSRIGELLRHMSAVTGSLPPLPSQAELDRVRYTPITASFARVAALSRQIAIKRGLAPDVGSEGECQGVVLDVAELWELYVLAVLRRLGGDVAVRHGTREAAAEAALLCSEIDGSAMGSLRPDAVVSEGEDVVGLLDAKYKQLHPTAFSPNGPQREDLYQLAAYLARLADRGPIWGILAYPFDPSRPELPSAEIRSPWRLDDRRRVSFVTLPHEVDDAAVTLRRAIGALR